MLIASIDLAFSFAVNSADRLVSNMPVGAETILCKIGVYHSMNYYEDICDKC